MNALQVYALLNKKISNIRTEIATIPQMCDVKFKKCGRIATINIDYKKINSWHGAITPSTHMEFLKLTDKNMDLRPYFKDDIVGYVDVCMYSDTNYTLTKTFKMPITFNTNSNAFKISTPYYPNGSNIYLSANITYITE